MNNSNPFQKLNPFGAASSSHTPGQLVANTLSTSLSPNGLGRQLVAAPGSAGPRWGSRRLAQLSRDRKLAFAHCVQRGL